MRGSWSRGFRKMLAVALLMVVTWTGFASAEDMTYTAYQPVKEFEVLELNDFCSNKEASAACSRMNKNYLKFFFSVFLAIAWGGAVRTIIKTFELSIPYTVVLLITGLGIGLGSRINVEFCQSWSQFTRFARTPPELILYIFLPVLLFESAFSMKAHVFMNSFLSILVIALPGMLITTFITAIGCRQFMDSYGWTFAQASLFGAIISATDPVAVVAILRESGTSEILSVMIEGESLLNDGVAILLYEIFKEVVEEPDSGEDQTLKVTRQFVQIAIGGPIFGWACGKIAIWCLSMIFNDAATEITITLVSAYLTYFVGEFYLGVSGVMAVVLLGVTINAGSTCISPEVMHTVHQFWQMMSFLANTVLFIILGIVIAETAINSYDVGDGTNVVWLYFFLNIIRLMMLILMAPFLNRTGYDASWRNLTVMMWGGLRGAVGICLALEVYKNKKLCKFDKVGSKFLLQTAGIVIMTLIINGSTTKMLLDYLGVTTISVGKLQDMSSAVKNLTASRVRTIVGLKHDRFLADANWEVVSRFTHLKDPYAKKRKQHDEKVQGFLDKKFQRLVEAPTIINEKLIRGGHLSMAILHDKSKGAAAPKAPGKNLEVIDINTSPSLLFIHQGKLKRPTHMNQELEIERETARENAEDTVIDVPDPNVEMASIDYKKLMEESRERVLKTMKISCWTQYEKGALSEEAVKVVVGAIEAKEDVPLTMVHLEDLHDHWAMKGVFAWLKKKFTEFMAGEADPPKPKNKFRQLFWWITTQTWFHGIIYFIIFLNLAPIIAEIVFMIQKIETKDLSAPIRTFLTVSSFVFTALYFMEFIIKIIGRGPRDYFSSKWNLIDFVVLVVAIGESIMEIVKIATGNLDEKSSTLGVVKMIRFIRFVRLLRWFRPLIPLLDRVLEIRINARLFMGYDVGKGYIIALEDALRFLPTMIPHEDIQKKFKAVLDRDRLKTVHELGLLHMSHTGVIVAVKTRHASKAISNYMKEELETMKFEGILEENEFELLNSKIDGNLKKLLATPSSIKPTDPEILLNYISWAVGNHTLMGYLQDTKELRKLERGQNLYNMGDKSHGIHLVLSGLLFLQYEPSEQIVRDYTQKGLLPNSEFVLDMTFTTTAKEYLGTGAVIGEYGYLTKLPRAARIRAETEVTLYYWSIKNLDKAMSLFSDEYDSFEARLWRNVAIRVAGEFLHTTSQYSSWSSDKIRAHLEQGVIPVGDKFSKLEVPEEIQEVILFFGTLMNLNTNETLVAPALVPSSWSRIGPPQDTSLPPPRVMLIAHDEEIELMQEKDSVTSLDKCILKAPGVAMSFEDEDNPLSQLSKSGKHRRRSVFVQSVANYSQSAATRRKSYVNPERRRTLTEVEGTRRSGGGKKISFPAEK